MLQKVAKDSFKKDDNIFVGYFFAKVAGRRQNLGQNLAGRYKNYSMADKVPAILRHYVNVAKFWVSV